MTSVDTAKRVAAARGSGPVRYCVQLALLSVLVAAGAAGQLIPRVAPLPALAARAWSPGERYVTPDSGRGAFALWADTAAAPIWVSANDYPGVRRVARQLQEDIGSVCGRNPRLSTNSLPPAAAVILIGTIGNSPLIDGLINAKRLDVTGIAGKWEASLTQVVEDPLPGVALALVIAGSDKRGTIYGMYDLSSQIGISPWHWWADVPTLPARGPLWVTPGRHERGEPKVKYRGIFINDEAPALSGWAEKTFGGFNARFYDHVFELILRLRGNLLWPAMWGKAFYDDDPENPRLADEYGIVIGTSHHEPMMRAQDEWRRYGKGGAWNYESNDSSLREFWRGGIRRMGSYESIVTLAMRGDGDLAMSETANVALLQRIVNDQRRILGEITGKDVTTIPQVWALYKEVQEYYDRGMRVPDDVTVLLCDDNWGNIRKLPRPSDPPHPGGYGMYYHFDFVGGPRNYKWINSTQIERVWEQMHLAYEAGVNRIWIVNVGDIKPLELPIQFFLDYAWNPEAITADDLGGYYVHWAAQQLGSPPPVYPLMYYTKFNARRKPELLDPSTYSLMNFREAERVVSEYDSVATLTQQAYDDVEPPYKDAFYELVLHPVRASATLNALYVAAAKNHLYASQGRAATNAMAQEVRDLFARDSAITLYYNDTLAHGRWSHMMDQTHIGYSSWQQPDRNVMPAVEEISVPARAEMGVAVEGSPHWWPADSSEAVLPAIGPHNRMTYFEVFNRGSVPFPCVVHSAATWLRFSSDSRRWHAGADSGTIGAEQRIWVTYAGVPPGHHRVPITITGPEGRAVTLIAAVDNPAPPRKEGPGFVEHDGYIAIEAPLCTRVVNAPTLHWITIPNLGRTGAAVTTEPSTAPDQTPGGDAPHLEYGIELSTTGMVSVQAYLSPVLDYDGGGRRYAVSLDDEPPQVVNITAGDTIPDWKYPSWWNEMVSNNIRIGTTRQVIREAGRHVLKFWMVDPGVVLQRLVVATRPPPASYLGPPATLYQTSGGAR